MPEWSDFIAAAERPEPTVVRVRTGRIDEGALVERLTDRGFGLSPLDGLPGFYRIDGGPRAVSMTLEHWLGLVYVQQASTGVAAPALTARPGERVLDLCAAPGGKTTHLAELMDDTGCLVAGEISESRIRGLLGNVYRLAHTNVFVISGDGRDFPGGACFDRVLVDAPCSGEGTLRRRGGHPPDQSPSFLAFVTRAQRALLERAVLLTRPGGEILYVTCTFAPEENEAVVSDALARLPVELMPLDLPVPHARGVTSFGDESYDPRVQGAARIYPHHLDSGGLFLAKLRRLDGDSVDRDAGWSPVPPRFPDDADVTRTPDEEADVMARLRNGIEEVRDRYEIGRSLDDVRWTMRGGRAWLHTVDEWPLGSWQADGWRPVSIGIRAIEFDTRGRPRPTNDFLRWAAAERAMVDLDAPALRRLLEGGALPIEVERRGPIAVGHRGDVIGRGAITADGLVSEVPKARGADLFRILAAHDEA